jgi:hypothetical protein
MSKEMKENNGIVRIETSFKERLVVIPVVLLVGLLSTLVYNQC